MKYLKLMMFSISISLSFQVAAQGIGLKMDEDIRMQELGIDVYSVEKNKPKFKCKGISRIEQISSGFQLGLDRFCSCFIRW